MLQQEIDENNDSLQYFYEKRRSAKKKVRELKKTINKFKNSKPRTKKQRYFQNIEIENIKEKILAYNLRVKWCTFNIKLKSKTHLDLTVKLEQVEYEMNIYFDNQCDERIGHYSDYLEEAAGAAFLLLKIGILFLFREISV